MGRRGPCGALAVRGAVRKRRWDEIIRRMNGKSLLSHLIFCLSSFAVLLSLTACRETPPAAEETSRAQLAPPPVAWALAIHGGAGTIAREKIGPELESEYRAALNQALALG